MPIPLNTARGIMSAVPSETYIKDTTEKGIDALRGIIGVPTNAELKTKALEQAKQKLYQKQQEQLPRHLEGFAPETIPKEYWLNETDAPNTDKMRVPAYRAGLKPKDTDPKTGLETLPMRGKDINDPSLHGVYNPNVSGSWKQTNKKTDPYLPMSQLYARARSMKAAEHLGIPQLTPEELAGLVLQEGGAGMGGGIVYGGNPKEDKIYNMLKEHGINVDNAGFLTQMKTKYDLAKRLKKPFGELWNGTGKNWAGTSGAQYAKNLEKQINAAKHPKNKQLMDLIHMGLAHGEAYPHKKPMPKGTPKHDLSNDYK